MGNARLIPAVPRMNFLKFSFRYVDNKKKMDFSLCFDV